MLTAAAAAIDHHELFPLYSTSTQVHKYTADMSTCISLHVIFSTETLQSFNVPLAVNNWANRSSPLPARKLRSSSPSPPVLPRTSDNSLPDLIFRLDHPKSQARMATRSRSFRRSSASVRTCASVACQQQTSATVERRACQCSGVILFRQVQHGSSASAGSLRRRSGPPSRTGGPLVHPTICPQGETP